jgi:hypothetical protein
MTLNPAPGNTVMWRVVSQFEFLPADTDYVQKDQDRPKESVHELEGNVEKPVRERRYFRPRKRRRCD